MTDRWNTTNVANVTATISGAVTLGAGSAAIGSVTVPLAASVYDVAEKTDLSTSAFQLASNVNTYGTWITNTSTSGQVLTVGGSTVTATRAIRKLYPGESGFFEVANSNLLYCFGSAASTAFTYGGY